jgi:hypothetical protein
VDAFRGLDPGDERYDGDELNKDYNVGDEERKVVKDADCPEVIAYLSQATIGRPSGVY